MPTESHSTARLHLFHLVSPLLPIGMFAYSQGLEAAITQKWVNHSSDAQDWIHGLLSRHLTQLDIPIIARLHSAFGDKNREKVDYWNRYLYASRETAELRAEDQALGLALARLLRELAVPEAAQWYQHHKPVCYATLFTLAAVHWQLSLEETAQAYLWSWLENQVAAAVKLIPLGQSEGQRILLAGLNHIPHCVSLGLQITDDDIGQTSPAFSIASAWHETQYSRLFRS
ncbi:urease accessory protein UreF [Thioflexithrix psekupsensis]|uniref:Urease accessory protein UreF n=1 Tax=Thioflexithrix psekupsensis TaxID=1570016 RepID=A0A251X7M6_9GAMM|nr:urease accessory protein UreF [Thioflexithrix psekupsensis]OUD13981.1 urease accessory protein UreF [Thioflexithrix psekupsensis]